MPIDDPTAGIPQADNEVIARRLLGDELVNRYGDVIGARKPTLVDALRDFTIASTKGIDKLEELRLKHREHYAQALTNAKREALAYEESERKKVQLVLDAYKAMQGLPPKHRSAILKETLESVGITPSRAALQMLTDADMAANLPIKKLEKAALDGTFTTGDVAAVFGSPLKTAEFLKSMATHKKIEEQTHNIVRAGMRRQLEFQERAAKEAQDPNEKARRDFLARNIARAKIFDNDIGMERPATLDELNEMADKIFGPRSNKSNIVNPSPQVDSPSAQPSPKSSEPFGFRSDSRRKP